MKWFGILLLSIITLLVIIILLIRLPKVQQKIVDYATNYVSEKTGTTVELERLYLGFDGNLQMEGLYLDTPENDTLVSLKYLEIGVSIAPLFRSEINISNIEIDGLVGRISVDEFGTGNYQFIIDAFANNNSEQKNVEEEDVKEDSGEGGFSINLDKLSLCNTDVSYHDHFTCMMIDAVIGCIKVFPDNLDLDAMNFELGEILLNDIDAAVSMCEGSKVDTTNSETINLILAWDKFEVDNLNFVYNDEVTSQEFDINLPVLLSQKFNLDLGKQKIVSNNFKIEDLNANIFMPSPANDSNQEDNSTIDTSISSTGISIGWEIEAKNFDLINNNLRYSTTTLDSPTGKFDQENLEFKQLNLKIENFNIVNDEIETDIIAFDFKERSGFTINQMSGEIFFGKQMAEIEDLIIRTPNSELGGALQVSYSNLSEIMSDPDNSEIMINMPNVKLDWKDANYFTDEKIPNNFTKTPLFAVIDIEGNLAALDLNDVRFRQSGNFAGRINGKVTNPTDMDRIVMDINIIDTRIYTKLIREFTNTSNEAINWKEVPLFVDLNAEFKGSPTDFISNLDLQTGKGSMKANVTMNANEKYKGDIIINNLAAGSIAGIPELGQVSLRLNVDGQYFDIKKAFVDLTLQIDSVDYNSYTYKEITADINLKNEIADILIVSDDPTIDFTLNGNAQVSENIAGDVELDLRYVDLKKLNLVEENYLIIGNINTNFELQDSSEMSVDLVLNQFQFFVDSEKYLLENSKFTYAQTYNTVDLTGQTGFLDLVFSSNLSQIQTFDLVKRQLGNYIGAMETETHDSILNTGYLQLDLAVQPNELITEVFLTQIEELRPLNIYAELDGSQNTIDFKMDSEKLIYGGMEMDSIFLQATGNGNNLTYDFHLNRFLVGDMIFYEPQLEGSFEGNELISTLSIKDEELETSNSISFGIIPQDSLTIFNLVHDELFINYENWNIDENNKLTIGTDFIAAENFEIFHNETKIQILTGHQNRNDNIRINIEDINLAKLSESFLTDTIQLTGQFDANVFVDNLYEKPQFEIKSNIDNLNYENYNFGKLSINLDPTSTQDVYATEIVLDGESSLEINGELILGDTLNFDQRISLKKVDMAMIEKFSGGALTESKGMVTGEFEIEGSPDDFDLLGDINFDDIEFVSTDLGKPFRLTDERISFTNRGIELNNFTLRDFDDNTIVLDGEILMTDFADIAFDLSLNANNFRALDLEETDGIPYYGQLVFSAETTIKGNLDLPVVRGRLKIEEETSLTVTIPEQSADLVDRENIVIFVDETSKRLREADVVDSSQNVLSTYKGLDLIAVLETAPEAAFRIIIDPVAGDHLDIKGASNLNLTINQAGDMSLTGRYDINSGSYQISMYDVVRRKFEIGSDSYILWQGDPLKAQMDITAVYEVRTDATDLLADQLVGADESKKTTYRQEITYLVNMEIKGSIEAPEISFRLDLPDGQKGVHGGVVYSRLQQLNQQESEVNKQAFALIVLGRFLTDSPTAASGGGEALARNSASKLLTQQLNNLAGKYIKGVDLNFNLDSYNDYSSGAEQGRTQLNVDVKKTLFSDRLILQVGSNIDLEGEENRGNQGTSSELVGDLVAEYLVTEDGRYRLKAFRKNEFEGMIDGQLINSGLSFVFVRETDSKKVKRKRKALESIKKEEEDVNSKDEE